MDRTVFDDFAARMGVALQRLEESRDRLLLAQTRMQIAAEQAEIAFASFQGNAADLDARIRRGLDGRRDDLR